MDLRGGSSTSTDGISNGGTYHDHELRSNPHILERTLGPLPKKTSGPHAHLQSISHALLHLAAEPKYIQPLREEVEAIVAAEGWTKAAMGKMWKIDSFLKESQRVNGVGLSMSIVRPDAISAVSPDFRSGISLCHP